MIDTLPDLTTLKPKPVPWLVAGLIPEGHLTLFTGGFGSYKSWLSLDLALAVHTGGLFANLRAKQRPVLYIDKENSPVAIANRLEAMRVAGSTELAGFRYWGNWIERPFPGVDAESLQRWAKQTRGLIVFDSLIRFHRGDENLNRDMAPAMEKFVALRDCGATVLVLHHTGKGDSPWRGATAIPDAADVCFQITRDDHEPRNVTIRGYKNRFTEETTIRVSLADGRFVIDSHSDWGK